MRKRIIDEETQAGHPEPAGGWLELEPVAQVELTSEDADHPIESALTMHAGSGWRADKAGKQTIRLLFERPLKITRIQLLFHEEVQARTQEIVLSWSADNGVTMREIVRQQYNFSPTAEPRELEDYTVELDGLTMLELSIIPDISGGDARASLARLRLA